MYSGYAANSALALRAKASLSHRRLRFSDDRPDGSCCALMDGCTAAAASSSLAGFSFRGVSVSPRVLYGYYYLRQSSLIHWSPSWRVVGRRERALLGRRQGVSCCCAGGSRESFPEMLGLLAEAEAECCCQESARFYQCSEEIQSEEGYGLKGRIRSGSQSSRMEEAMQEEDRKTSRNGSRSRMDYSSASSSAFSSDSQSEEHRRRRVSKASTASSSKNENFARGRMRKPEEDANLQRTSNLLFQSNFRKRVTEQRNSDSRNAVESKFSGRVEKDTILADSAYRARQEQIREENRRLKEELEKLSKTPEVQEESNKRDSSYKKLSDVKVDGSEETSALTASLLQELARQRIEINQLRESYQSLLNRSEVQETNVRRTSVSNEASSSRLEDREVISTSILNLVEELKRQRVVIEQLSKSYQELVTSSETFKNETERVHKSEKVFVSRVREKEEASTSTLKLIEQGKEQHSNVDQSRIGYQMIEKSSDMVRSGSQQNSSSSEVSISRPKDMEKISTSGFTSVANFNENERQQHSHAGQYRKDHQKMASSEMHESATQLTSTSKQASSSNLKDRKVTSSSTANLVDGRRDQHSYADQFRKAYQRLIKSSEMSDVHDIDTEKASSLSTVAIAGSRDKGESSTSAVNVTAGRINEQMSNIDEQRESTSGNVTISRSQDIREGSDSAVNVTVGWREEQMSCVNEQKISGSAKVTVSTSQDKGESSTSAVNLTDGKSEEQYRYIDEKSTEHADLRKGSFKRTDISEIKGKPVDPHRESALNIEDNKDNPLLVLVQEVEEKEKTDVFEGPKSPGSIASTTPFTGASEAGSLSAQAKNQQIDAQIRVDDLYQVRHDTLETVSRLEKSSSEFVGEFVDVLRQEMTDLVELDGASVTSAIQIKETRNETEQITNVEQSHILDASEENKIVKSVEGSSQSLELPESRGPSNEMWDLTGQSQKPSPTKELENESSGVAAASSSQPANVGNAIIRRSGRSLWDYIADIFRLGWRPRIGSHTSTGQSATRSSSNESESSDAWFSGHEPEKDDYEKNLKGKRIFQKETDIIKVPTSIQASASQVSVKEAEATKKVTYRKTDELLSTGMTGGHDLLPDLSQSHGPKMRMEGGILGQSDPSTPEVLLPSSSYHLSPLHNIKLGKAEMAKVQMHGNRSQESEKDPLEGSLVETEVKDSDFRRRKLQRKKQVLREQFDEWEEAHNLEMEQRKTDEYFMREALLEAKKAGDAWEVPIGAVLVQNGQIIARGSNLVEELRDSTAHAEMICIREASNFLKTWRLSETTLYVTLEPCPMCAGAILQARVDTVVWGAPNKLLGADGSWVRLFPGRDDGKDSLDKSNQSIGPIHPFHPKITIRRGILATECSEVMQQFFQLRRKEKKQEQPQHARLPFSTPTKLLTKMHDLFGVMFCLS